MKAMKEPTAITLKLYTPRNASFRTEVLRAPKGCRIETGEELDEQIDAFCASYENAYPGNKFAVQKISRRWYNIVWVGE